MSHTGSPFRLAILDANETSKIVLLDHIPHWSVHESTLSQHINVSACWPFLKATCPELGSEAVSRRS